MSTLERAVAIAARAYEGQTDKAGAPYLLHPLRIMLKFSTLTEQITAVLHDVVEDSEISLGHLRREGFSDGIIHAIDAVTRRPNESYEAFIRRAATHPIGWRVKLADLEDNCDIFRITNPTKRDRARIARYRRAIKTITAYRRNRED